MVTINISVSKDIEEDAMLDSLASERDTRDAVFISHKEVWKNISKSPITKK
ncbi:hypothetical protein COB87_003230 [Candidatus Wolfebacteria bacterium]|nr:hypothetical protein [Candidatus Wolfebacteria bacterium]